jgi:hypothetical protein
MLDHMTGHNKTSLRSDIAVFVFPSFHHLTSRQILIWYTGIRLFAPHVYRDDKKGIQSFERTTRWDLKLAIGLCPPLCAIQSQTSSHVSMARSLSTLDG